MAFSDAFGVRRARTGSILADDGTIYHVKWDDTGEEERVRRAADVHVATRGSLRFLALSDTRLFHAVFAQEPLAVVLHLLADSPVPLNTTFARRTSGGYAGCSRPAASSRTKPR